MARRIKSHEIAGPAGLLEAILEEPDGGWPREACLVCHPHPLHGGTMHNKVVYRIAKGLRQAGVVVLRFNFRGVGRSQGEHGHMAGEIDDACAALDWLRARYPQIPYSLAGFSFGSRVIMKLGCERADAVRLIAVGFPTWREPVDYLRSCGLPKFFVQSTVDEHGPLPALEEIVSGIPEPKRLLPIEAKDHFFEGALPELEQVIEKIAKGEV